jgi:hypothetical protein
MNLSSLPPMVQLYFVTMGGATYTLIGPVTHLPEMGMEAGNLEAFEAGEIIPATLAARFVSADGDNGTGVWWRGMEQ